MRRPVPIVTETPRGPLLPNGVLGMLIFVFTEVMLFAGLVSAFTIIRAGATQWPPPGQPRLPLEETLINTAALFGSGLALYWARRTFRLEPARAKGPLLLAIGLGAFFVAFQGAEWLALLRQGLTLTSSALGSFFYLIVGLHGLHAIAALALLVTAWWRLQRGSVGRSLFATAEVLWYFVVGVWPVLYWRVYW